MNESKRSGAPAKDRPVGFRRKSRISHVALLEGSSLRSLESPHTIFSFSDWNALCSEPIRGSYKNSSRDFTARLRRVPCSARCGRGEKNSLSLRHLFASFRPPLRASAAHTLTNVKSKGKAEIKTIPVTARIWTPST